jgi:uncharacterized C2H2 Zn-finger protein
MSTNYLDNRSLLDLRTKAAFVKAVNNVNSTRALGESDNDELKDDVEDVIFNFKEWLIENKKLLESVDSKFKTTIEKYPVKEGIKSYLYQFAEETTKKQLSTSIDSTIHIIEELDTINLDSVDFDVFEKTITDLSMLLYSNQEYGSENILFVLEDSYKNVTDEAEIIKDPEEEIYRICPKCKTIYKTKRKDNYRKCSACRDLDEFTQKEKEKKTKGRRSKTFNELLEMIDEAEEKTSIDVALENDTFNILGLQEGNKISSLYAAFYS